MGGNGGSDTGSSRKGHRFQPGNTCNVKANQAKKGVPHRGPWIRQQIQETCSDVSIARLKALGESGVPADQAIYWQIVGKTLPQHIEAEVGGLGSLGAECDAALERAGLNGKFKTELGE